MLQTSACVIFAFFLWFEISVGQSAYFKNDNPFPFGVSDLGASAPTFSQDLSSSERLSNEKNDQISTEQSTSSLQSPFLRSEPSATISAASQNFPTSNPSAIESFISELKSSVYTSKILPDILDFRGMSPETFSKYIYDYITANFADVTKGNPYYYASSVSNTLKKGMDDYTLPIILDIYGNTFAKFLFGKGILNASNASSLAKKYAKILEDNAELKWEKGTPESKLLVFADGFVDYLKATDHFRLDSFDDLLLEFVNAVKAAAAKF